MLSSQKPALQQTTRLFGLLLAILPCAAQIEGRADVVKQAVVMLDCTHGDDSEYGAGILFAVNGSTAKIVTAAHVVSRCAPNTMKARFLWGPSERVAARVLNENAAIDIAVLQVS